MFQFWGLNIARFKVEIFPPNIYLLSINEQQNYCHYTNTRVAPSKLSNLQTHGVCLINTFKVSKHRIR